MVAQMRCLTATTVLALILLQGASGATQRHESDVDAHARIAYSCNGGICVIYPDGSRRQQLTRDLFTDSYPSWSPDGHSIAFTGNLGRTVIDVINADGSARRRLTPRSGNDALPAWSPDGRTIAFDNNTTRNIDLMNIDGSRRRLTHRPSSLPTWSPGGKRIAFVSGDGRRLALTSGDIYVINVDGSGERRLAQNGAFPAWSPDGTQIAFIRNGAHWSRDAAIWIMSADGSHERRLWSHSAEGGALSWSPSGKTLAFTYDSEIYTIQADGRRLHRVTLAGDNLDPAWQPPS
jgi:Tol biopolymer transport system component